MQNSHTSPPWLYRWWLKCLKVPAGRWLFSRGLAWAIPYSGNLRASILEMRPGHCLLRLRDRRALRNHLHSIHALALANAGELCSGLALHTVLPNHLRGIPVEISTRYLSKARGPLLATGSILDPMPECEGEVRVQGELKNTSGEVVAITTVQWKIAPRPRTGQQP